MRFFFTVEEEIGNQIVAIGSKVCGFVQSQMQTTKASCMKKSMLLHDLKPRESGWKLVDNSILALFLLKT